MPPLGHHDLVSKGLHIGGLCCWAAGWHVFFFGEGGGAVFMRAAAEKQSSSSVSAHLAIGTLGHRCHPHIQLFVGSGDQIQVSRHAQVLTTEPSHWPLSWAPWVGGGDLNSSPCACY